ncbi:MAG: hypothetical protein PHO03_06130 [Candidatus Omnitrophica bacterium]|nr:hypothetical protein [Candidatus Omnitrophota bacterium]
MANLELRKFTDLDWDAFSGAEEVPGGPLIAESTMGGKDAVVIVDRDQVVVYTDIEENEGYALEIAFPAGKIIAAHLKSPIDRQQLKDFGFKSI